MPDFLPFITVYLSSAGDVHYRLNPTTFSPEGYGVVLATLAQQIARMMHEQMPDQPQILLQAQIVQALLIENRTPTAATTQDSTGALH